MGYFRQDEPRSRWYIACVCLALVLGIAAASVLYTQPVTSNFRPIAEKPGDPVFPSEGPRAERYTSVALTALSATFIGTFACGLVALWVFLRKRPEGILLAVVSLGLLARQIEILLTWRILLTTYDFLIIPI